MSRVVWFGCVGAGGSREAHGLVLCPGAAADHKWPADTNPSYTPPTHHHQSPPTHPQSPLARPPQLHQPLLLGAALGVVLVPGALSHAQEVGAGVLLTAPRARAWQLPGGRGVGGGGWGG